MGIEPSAGFDFSSGLVLATISMLRFLCSTG
jgi:hypothetical protein